ncbi:MAG: hypothetical protein WAN92_00135 [Herbaspirillum sp.]
MNSRDSALAILRYDKLRANFASAASRTLLLSAKRGMMLKADAEKHFRGSLLITLTLEVGAAIYTNNKGLYHRKYVFVSHASKINLAYFSITFIRIRYAFLAQHLCISLSLGSWRAA